MKRSRNTKNRTYAMFVHTKQTDENPYVTCRCGCISASGDAPLSYHGQVIGRHVRTHHPELHKEFKSAKKGEHNFNELEAKIRALDEEAQTSMKTRRMTIDNFFTKKHEAFDHVTRANLLLLMWACANSIPRFVMDCPLFDAMYRQLGCNPGPNRHEIQSKYLPQLDRLVVNDFRLRLKNAKVVSLSADGYRDRVRRDWIDVSICYVESGAKWTIEVLHPDIVLITQSATADTIELLVSEMVQDWVTQSKSL